MVITLHKFIQQGLNSDSAQFQILFAACRRFAMAKVLQKDPGWRKDYTPFVGQLFRKTSHQQNSWTQ